MHKKAKIAIQNLSRNKSVLSGVLPSMARMGKGVARADFSETLMRKCTENLHITKLCILSLSLSRSLSYARPTSRDNLLIFNGLARKYCTFFAGMLCPMPISMMNTGIGHRCVSAEYKQQYINYEYKTFSLGRCRDHACGLFPQ